jgi:hypothetical protein
MFGLQPPRHISTLPFSTEATAPGKRVDVGCWPDSSGPFHKRRFVGQYQEETYAAQHERLTRSPRRRGAEMQAGYLNRELSQS